MNDTNNRDTGRTGDTDSDLARCLTDRLLTDAGLTTAEARLYRALLHLPGADAATLAWQLAAPTGAVAKQLRRLVRRSFATTDDGEPARYRPLDPAVALHLAAAHRQHVLLRELGTAGRVTAALPAVVLAVADDRHRLGYPDPPVTVLDPADVAGVHANVAASATVTLRLVVASPGGGDPPLAPGSARRRTLYRRGLLDDDNTYQRAKRDILQGDDVRLLPEPGPSLLIADDHTAIVHSAGRTLVLYPSPLLDTTTRYFDALFDRALPFGSRGDAETTWLLSDDDRELLRLLAAGLKDQAIARHLNIGLRTVVRRIGTLARALDADTRFQLGLQARARGMI